MAYPAMIVREHMIKSYLRMGVTTKLSTRDSPVRVCECGDWSAHAWHIRPLRVVLIIPMYSAPFTVSRQGLL
jgi:hypothetical protein